MQSSRDRRRQRDAVRSTPRCRIHASNEPPRPIRLTATLALTLAWVAGQPTPSRASEGPFASGSARMSVLLGARRGDGQAGGVIVGAGMGYFALDGLELGLSMEQWFGSPSVTKVSPEVRYVVHQLPSLAPYVGVFASHWFVGGGRPDSDTAGLRVGAIYAGGRRASHVGLGLVHERVLGTCSSGCAMTYPEVVVALRW